VGRGRLAPLRGRMPRPTTQRNFQGKEREDRAGPRRVVRRALRRAVFRMRFSRSKLVWTTPRLRPPRYPGPVRAYARRTCRSGFLERLVREGSSWVLPNERCAATPATAIALRTSEQWVLKRHPTMEALEELENRPHTCRDIHVCTLERSSPQGRSRRSSRLSVPRNLAKVGACPTDPRHRLAPGAPLSV
jgi:hypothetical protein